MDDYLLHCDFPLRPYYPNPFTIPLESSKNLQSSRNSLGTLAERLAVLPLREHLRHLVVMRPQPLGEGVEMLLLISQCLLVRQRLDQLADRPAHFRVDKDQSPIAQ